MTEKELTPEMQIKLAEIAYDLIYKTSIDAETAAVWVTKKVELFDTTYKAMVKTIKEA